MVEIRLLGPQIGVEVRGVDVKTMDEATWNRIYQAWLDHLVIIFPGQKLSQEDLLRATTFFGENGGLSRPREHGPGRAVPPCGRPRPRSPPR